MPKFQPAPPHGGRHTVIQRDKAILKFQPAPPHGGRPPHSHSLRTCGGATPEMRTSIKSSSKDQIIK